MIIRLFSATNEQFTFQQIMKDRWINAGHEEDELKPFVEPELDISDQKRIGNYSVHTCVCAQQRFCFDLYACSGNPGKSSLSYMSQLRCVVTFRNSRVVSCGSTQELTNKPTACLC